MRYINRRFTYLLLLTSFLHFKHYIKRLRLCTW